MTLFLLNPAYAAQTTRTIKGIIVAAEDKEPVIGATVAVSQTQLKKSGTTKPVGTVTDIDGNFELTIPAGVDQIECRAVGFNPRTIYLVDGVDSYDIMLDSSAEMLGEVVVTGYQAIERRKLTASITKMNIDEDKLGSVMNIDQALAGQVAGLSAMQSSGTPGAPLKIRIRGTSSLQGNQDPLWVIDGVPMNGTEMPSTDELKDIDNLYQSSIAGLNPSDIESITVLKDAAATAIYGTRAANGVIVITTKNGKKGKTQVSFSTRLSYSPKPGIGRLNLLNADEKVDLELELLRTNFTYRENKGEVSRILQQAQLLDAYKTGGWDMLPSDVQSRINALRNVNTDWNDILFRDTFSQEYNISASGGGDKATYYTSLGFQDERGNVEGVGMSRFNVVLKTRYSLSDSFKIGASLFANYRQNDSYLTDNDGFSNPVYYSRRANPYQLPYDNDGNYIYDTDIQGREDSELKFNVFEERNNTKYSQKTTGVTALIDANLRITDFLKANTQIGFQLDDVNTESYAGKETYAMRKEFYRTEVMNPDGNRVSFLPDGGRHIQNKSSNKQINWKGQLEYSDRFGTDHELELMAGSEIRKTWYDYFSSTAYGYDPKTLTNKPVIFPNESWARTFPLHLENKTENAFASFYANGSYSLKSRYILGASVRFDGSDLFGVDKKYRFLPLYSFSALWRISEEPFLQESTAVNNLALRASYGIQGNIDKSTSSFVMGNYNQESILPGVSEDVIVLGTPPNRRLRWEKTYTANVGIDAAFFDNILTASVDAYYRKGSDLIALKMLPLETGFMSTMVNWASMRNRGIEIALSSRNISTPKFRWTTNFNIAYNENTVLQETVPFNQTTPSREGYPVSALFAYRTAGLDSDGYPLFWLDGNKVTAKEFLKLNGAGASTLTAEEQRERYSYIGSGEPLWTGGFINSFYYGNFDLTVNFAFNLKMYTRIQPSYSPVWFDHGMNTNRDILDRWTPSNPDATLPALMPEGYRSDERTQYGEFSLYSMLDSWVKRSDYVRLQSLILGYNLPTSLLAHAGISTVRVAVEARNLFVFGANYKNFLDPETMGNPFAQPIPKSFTFNLQVKF